MVSDDLDEPAVCQERIDLVVRGDLGQSGCVGAEAVVEFGGFRGIRSYRRIGAVFVPS